MDSFGQMEHAVVQAGERYSEMITTAQEPGLASIRSVTIKVPGMRAQLISIHPEGALRLSSWQERECIQSAFILNGFADSTFNDRPVITKGNSHAFQYSPFVDENHKIVSDNLEALHIDFEIDFFKSLIQPSNSGKFELLSNKLEKKETFLTPPSSLPLQVRMGEIIHCIKNCAFDSATRSIFIEAKMLELFALQVEQITRIDPNEKELCSKADREKLFAVKDFLEKNYLDPLSLRQLGMMFGLNEFKLKRGYKHLFRTTVFGHIHNMRMQKAMQLLSQKNMTVSEVAGLIGYSSSSNFSAEFKKKFGYPPTKVN